MAANLINPPTVVNMLFGCCGLMLAVSAMPVMAGQPPTSDIEFFELKIRPVLAQHCYRCHGASKQELSLRAVEDRVHVHDLHATILHTLGIDHMRLVFDDDCRRENPTINTGNVVKQVFQV